MTASTLMDSMDNARMIADSAAEFAKGSGGVARARAVRDQALPFDQAAWQQIVELGWLGMLVPETHNGLGLEERDMCALLESVGRVLLPEPLVPAIAAGRLLATCDSRDANAALAGLLTGSRLWTMAVAPSVASSGVIMRHVADCHPGMGLLVAHGAGAGFELRVTDTVADGVALHNAACVDGSTLADISITASAWKEAPICAAGSTAQTAWNRAHDTMLLGYAAYLVGLMDEALHIAVEYMKVRKQFGAPIGSFQALQHRAASCHVDVVASRALVYEACKAFGTGRQAWAACAAKARASAAALRVTKEAVQFHGAIGFADEHDIGLYLRRAMTIGARLGGEMQQKLRLDMLHQ